MGTQDDTTRSSSAASGAPQTPEDIGPYRILEPIGEGGFGVVYLAEQTRPMSRRVALKLIKPGMDSKEVIARFEAERQALALMDHPCIARVLDGGVTDRGAPYFVMELVRGLPVTEHCDTHKLDIRRRLELFTRICDAVQHAHAKAVLHRDLKPSNILVEYENGISTPKVIDFGVAKALGQKLTAATIFTAQGQLIGTPEYMSPEQAEMSAQDVDTRSDIYSLGVILYELLTGSRPFDSNTLRQAGLAEIQRIIREVDPPRPSTRLQSMVGHADPSTATQVMASRQVELRTLSGVLRRDLDWVVMKCLEKDRERRYGTANAVAMEIQRFLNDEPVTAGPPSVGYRASKFIRRHRTGVVAATCIVVALIVATGVSLAFGVAATRERDRAERLLVERDDALDAERRRVEELDAVAGFQEAQLADVDAVSMGLGLRTSLRDKVAALADRRGLDETTRLAMLTEFDAMTAGADLTSLALDALETNIFTPALRAIDAQFADQPALRASLLQTVASTMHALGLLEAAGAPQATALEIRRATLGDDHPDTLASIDQMGVLLQDQGKATEAEVLNREAFESRQRVLGDDHPDTISALGNMGTALIRQGRIEDAESCLERTLEARRRVLGDDHSDTVVAINNLGYLRWSQGRLADAETLYREALAIRRRILDPAHPDLWTSLNNLAVLLDSRGKGDEANDYYRQALELSRHVLGDQHPNTLTSVSNMGKSIAKLGDLAGAEPYYREALTTRRRVLGDEHPHTLDSINSMGVLLRAQGRVEEAEPYYMEALETRRRVLGPAHPNTITSLNDVGNLLLTQDRPGDAEQYLRASLEARQAALGNEHPETLRAMHGLGLALSRQERLEDAEPWLDTALEVRRRTLGDDHPATLVSIGAMGDLRRQQGRLDDADALGAESVRRAQDALGDRHWQVGISMVKHATTLVALQRFAEAETRAIDAHGILVDAYGTDHRRTRQAIELLRDLYTAWHAADPDGGHDIQAEEWRSALDG